MGGLIEEKAKCCLCFKTFESICSGTQMTCCQLAAVTTCAISHKGDRLTLPPPFGLNIFRFPLHCRKIEGFHSIFPIICVVFMVWYGMARDQDREKKISDPNKITDNKGTEKSRWALTHLSIDSFSHFTCVTCTST